MKQYTSPFQIKISAYLNAYTSNILKICKYIHHKNSKIYLFSVKMKKVYIVLIAKLRPPLY